MNTQTALTNALQVLNPIHLTLDNESHLHAGYYEGKESHFRLTIASEDFIGLRLAGRHQKIYALVNDFLTSQGGSVHALAIFAYTPEEWANVSQAPTSPVCASRR